jgi:hypothetical protein
MDNNERERVLRERVRARGFEMRKSQGATPPAANQGEYMVYDPLADIERWLPDE